MEEVLKYLMDMDELILKDNYPELYEMLIDFDY